MFQKGRNTMKKWICTVLCLSIIAGMVSVDAKADSSKDKTAVSGIKIMNTGDGEQSSSETPGVDTPPAETVSPAPSATALPPSAGKLTVRSEDVFTVLADSSDKSCVITGYKGSTAVTTLYIPEKIDGNTVSSVSSGVFAGCPYLKNVVVQGDVEFQGSGMFPASGVEIWGKSGGKSAVYAAASGLVFHPLEGPSSISAKKGSGMNQAVITWSGVNGAVSYHIYRKKGKGKYSLYRNVTGVSFTNEKLGAGSTYTYKVSPVFMSADGESIEGHFSKEAKASMKPAKLKKVKARGIRGGIQVRWKRNKNASGYQVFMKVHVKGFKTNFNRVKTIKKNKITGYKCRMLVRGMKYSYKVRAFKKVKGKKIYGPFVTVSAKAK